MVVRRMNSSIFSLVQVRGGETIIVSLVARITSPLANFVGQQVVVACSPCGSYLTQVLRHPDGDSGATTGIMPYFPENTVFSTDDMDRVSAWIAAGAQNN